MFLKVLKYDLKWVFSLINVFYILALVFAILARLTSLIEDSFVFMIINKILSATSISMMVSAFVNVITRSWVRFKRNMYGDESYLSHTLPVSKSVLYCSKTLTSVIAVFSTFIVLLACILLCYYSENFVEGLKLIVNSSAQILDISVGGFVFYLLLIIILEFIYILFAGYTGMIIGHRFNQNKMGMSVLFGFAIYMVCQTVMVIVMFIGGLLFSKELLELFTSTNPAITGVKTIFALGCILYFAFDVAIFFVGKHQLSKGVNVD